MEDEKWISPASSLFQPHGYRRGNLSSRNPDNRSESSIFWLLQYRKRIKLDAEWEKRYPRAAFRYCGETLLFYEHSHGNQIEFLDPNGYCYLWYPGNSIILVGRWRANEKCIFFQYGINTFNPVTGVLGGHWEMCPIDAWSVSIVRRCGW